MKNKQLTFGATLSYGAIVFNIVSGLLYTPWMIKTIGDDQYALYTLAMSIINIFLLDFGIGSAVTKFLSNYYAKNQQEEANRFMGIVYKVFFIISALIALALTVFYFLIDAIYVKLTPQEIVTFKHLFIIVAVYSISTFPFTTFNGTLMANERFIELKACNFAQKIVSVILIVIFLLLDQGIYALVLIHAITNVLSLGIKYLFIRKKTTQRANIRSWNTSIAKNLFGYSLWITVISLSQRCIFNIMPTIIAATVGSVEVTLFSLAATLEGYVYTFADAINGMFMPEISRILTKENADQRLTSLMSKVGKFHIYTLGLIFVGFICIGKDFILQWMGNGYDSVYLCTILLLVPSMIQVPQQVANTALLAKDVVKEQAIVYLLMAVVNITLSFALLPILGIYGAAVAICIAYLIRTIGLNILYHKKLPIKLGQYFKDSYPKWLIVALLTIGLGFGFARIITLNGWNGIIIKAVCIILVYIFLLISICLDKKEKQYLYSKIKK